MSYLDSDGIIRSSVAKASFSGTFHTLRFDNFADRHLSILIAVATEISKLQSWSSAMIHAMQDAPHSPPPREAKLGHGRERWVETTMPSTMRRR
jgi:hypothetical protein